MLTPEIISKCIKGDRQAQFALYKQLSPGLMAVCMRYLKYREDAEDALQIAFVKIFKYINTFQFKGPFEAWARKITVGVAIDHYHQKNKANVIIYEDNQASNTQHHPAEDTILERFDANELIAKLNQLPENYRLILNLYAIEGYAHKEIAEMLHITEGSSRSQLSRARAIFAAQCFPQVDFPIYGT